MRIFFWSFSFIIVLTTALYASTLWGTNPVNNGITLEAFRNFANSLPQLPGNIQSICLFRGLYDHEKTSAAFATFDEQAGWQIHIFDAVSGEKPLLVWQSGKLDDSFSVSYPSALKIFKIGIEDTVVFEGCAPHVCPDVFSIMIYVPSRRTAYVAKYIRGDVTYSPPLNSEEKELYKSAFEQLVDERRNQ